MCQHPEKVSYATLRAAAWAAGDALATYGPQRPYPCDCGRFHLTSQPLAGSALTADMVRELVAAVG